MPTTKENLAKLMERRPLVCQLYLRGRKAAEIHKALIERDPPITCDLSTIHRDINALVKEWQRVLVDDPVKIKAAELATYEEAERECWIQYARTRQRGWLSELREWKKRKADLLGLDKAIAINVVADVVNETHVSFGMDYSTWTDEQLAAEWERTQEVMAAVAEANTIVGRHSTG